jgi:hypothetical protein
MLDTSPWRVGKCTTAIARLAGTPNIPAIGRFRESVCAKDCLIGIAFHEYWSCGEEELLVVSVQARKKTL